MKKWIAARRARVAQDSASSAKRSFDEVAREARELGNAAWTESHDYEEAFHKVKRRKHF